MSDDQSPSPFEEPAFLARLRARDERAFDMLVRAYERRVCALIVRMLGTPAEAQDVAQEVFVQVFRAIDQFRGESRLSTWIFRIAVNLTKNRALYLQRRHSGQGSETEDAHVRWQSPYVFPDSPRKPSPGRSGTGVPAPGA